MKIRNKFAALLVVGLFTGCGSSGVDFVSTAPVRSDSTVSEQPPELLAPVARDDAFDSLGSYALTVTADNGLLANDDLNGATITAFDSTSLKGGTVQIDSQGAFIYESAFGFEGTDSFTYTLENTAGPAQAAVTITVSGTALRVDNRAVAGGDGSRERPFSNLQEALTASQDGDFVIVSRGNGSSYPGPIVLPQGVALVSEQAEILLAQTVVPATLPPVLQGPVVLLGDNTLSGFNVSGPQAVEASNTSNVRILSNSLMADTGEVIDLEEVTGVVEVSGNRLLMQNDAHGIDLKASSGDSQVAVSDNFFGLTGDLNAYNALELNYSGNSRANFRFERNTVTGSGLGSSANIEEAVDVIIADSSQMTFTSVGNQISFIDERGLSFDVSSDATLSFTSELDEFLQVDEECFGFFCKDRTSLSAVISSANIDASELTGSAGEEGVTFTSSASHDGSFSLEVRDSAFTRTDEDPIWIRSRGSAIGRVVLTGNQFLQGEQALEFILDGSTQVCFSILNNLFDGQNLELSVGGTATAQVRQLTLSDGGPLDAQRVNSFVNGAQFLSTTEDSGAIVSRPDGCP